MHSEREDVEVGQFRSDSRQFHGLGVVALVLSLGLTACDLGGSDGPPSLYPDADVTETPGSMDPVITRPILQATDSQGRICTDKGAVIGRAQPGSTVIARGPGGTAYGGAGSSDGRFCVAVPLKKGAQNRIQVFSDHPFHKTSQVSVLTLTHAGPACPQQAAAPVIPASADPTNVEGKARIIQIESNGDLKSGDQSTWMIDGDPETHAHYSSSGAYLADDSMYLTLTLNKVAVISKVVIHWGNHKGYGTSYGGHYFVGVSADKSPANPPHTPDAEMPIAVVGDIAAFIDGLTTDRTDHVDEQQSAWTYLAEVKSGNGGQDEVDMSSYQPVAQHIGLWLEADGGIGAYEHYLISEIEVHTVQPQVVNQYVPTTGADEVCSGAY